MNNVGFIIHEFLWFQFISRETSDKNNRAHQHSNKGNPDKQ